MTTSKGGLNLSEKKINHKKKPSLNLLPSLTGTEGWDIGNTGPQDGKTQGSCRGGARVAKSRKNNPSAGSTPDGGGEEQDTRSFSQKEASKQKEGRKKG